MIIILGTKKYVNIFKFRCYVCVCIFVCMANHGQISYDLSEIPYFLLEGAKPCNGVSILKWLYLHEEWAASCDPGTDL